MPGGLVNIYAYGVSDLFLTGTPQITFFKKIYRRHTHFASESVVVDGGNINFGDEITIPIPRVGDMIGKTYVKFSIPEIRIHKKYLVENDNPILDDILNNPPLQYEPDEQHDILLYNVITKINYVKEFVKGNVRIYRHAYTLKDIVNITSASYINTIFTAYQIPLETLNNYKDALTYAVLYDNYLQVDNSGILSYKTTDIMTVLYDNIIIPVSTNSKSYNDFTVQQVFELIENTIETCKLMYKYFFDKLMKFRQIEIEKANGYAKFAWVEKLGPAMIDYVSINIGGEQIDRLYGDFINIWFELTCDQKMFDNYNKMFGNVPSMTTYDTNAKPAYDVIVPLDFWFKSSTYAIPHIALQYAQPSITIKLKPLERCAYVEYVKVVDEFNTIHDLTQIPLSDVWENLGLKVNVSLITDYYFLDQLERKRIATTAHEYLINTHSMVEVNNVTLPDQLNISLNFNGPTSELIWVAQKNAYIDGASTQKKMPFNYTYGVNGDNPFISSELMLNTELRYKYTDPVNFNYLHPLKYHSRTPSKGINVYSFSLFPEQDQPSGSCNLSRFKSSDKVVKLDPRMFTFNTADITLDPFEIGVELPTRVTIRVYQIRKNILRIIGGMGALAYR